MADQALGAAVLLFDDARLPRPLSGLPTHHTEGSGDIAALLDALPPGHRRLVVVGDDAQLATVLTRLLRTDRLDVEVGYAPPGRTHATRAYGLSAGSRGARRARHGTARRVPLIRDETGSVIVGRAGWLPADESSTIHGEAIVDDTVLFDGAAAEVWIEPTLALPGLRACVPDGRPWRRWIGGRAAQLGTTGAAVVRDGVAAPRTVRRSTFYRNVEGWLLVR
jgi:hypothetical protein